MRRRGHAHSLALNLDFTQAKGNVAVLDELGNAWAVRRLCRQHQLNDALQVVAVPCGDALEDTLPDLHCKRQLCLGLKRRAGMDNGEQKGNKGCA